MVARPTLFFGLASLALLGVLLPGCIDFNKGGGGHSGGGGGGGGGGGAVVPAVPVNIVSPGSVEDERFDGRAPGGFFVGADTIPRLAFLRVTDSNTSGTFDSTEGVVGDTSQVMYTRRRPDGSWTTPIGVSAADGDFKENPILVVVGTGTNAAISFIFWREFRVGTAEVHVARVDANDPPSVIVGSTDTVISDGTLPTGMVGGSTPGSVTAGTLSAVLDTVDGSVFAAWAQFFSGDECVVAARYHVGGVGGAGLEPDEKTGITVNNGGAAANVDQDAAPGVQLFFSPTPLVSNATFAPASTGGTVHAIYVSTDADGASLAVRSRTRTAPGTWTPGAPGDVVSDTAAAFYRFPRPTSEGDGDVFLAWTQGAALPTDVLCHAYHSVTLANFDASVVALPSTPATGYGDLAIALDLSVPVLAYKRQTSPAGDLSVGSVTGSPNLSGPFAAEQVLKTAIAVAAGEGPGRIYLYREDSTFRIAAVYDAPSAAGAPFDVFGRARPTLGVFGAETNLSATAAVISRLAGFDRVTGSAAQFVWLEGANAGPREVTGVRYDAGTFGAAVNISGSPADSKGGEAGQTFEAGNVGVFGTSSGTPAAHIWWRDVSGAVQHDPFFAQQ